MTAFFDVVVVAATYSDGIALKSKAFRRSLEYTYSSAWLSIECSFDDLCFSFENQLRGRFEDVLPRGDDAQSKYSIDRENMPA